MSEGRRAESRPAGLFAVNVAAVLFGSNALFGHIDASPVAIVAGRCLFACATLYIAGKALGLGLAIPLRDARAAGATAILFALNLVTFFASVKVGGVAIAALTIATFPFFTLLIDAARARRLPHAAEIWAGAAILLAIWLVVGPEIDRGDGLATGATLGLVSALCFAAFTIASRPLVARLGSLRLTLYQYAAVFLLLLPILPFVRGLATVSDWGLVAVLGIVGTALALQLFLFALERLPAAACGGFLTLEPIYAILLAALVFGEPIAPMVAVSAAIITTASWLLMRTSASRGQPASG